MQGVAVWLWAVVIAIILAILTAIAGSQWDILANLQSLPRIPVTPETATLTGILTALGATVVALIGAILDGLRRGVGGLLRGGAVAESDSGTDRGDRAVRSTVVPIAVSHPKNADPNLKPPNSAFSRSWTSVRSV